MTETRRPGVAVSAIQLAWLGELGLDRRLIAQLAQEPAPQAPVPQQAPPAPVSAQGVAEAPQRAKAPPQAPLRQPASAPFTPAQRPAAPQPPASPAHIPQDWEALQAHLASCQGCGLHAARATVVPGAGATQAVDWLVVGEAPGDHDDRTGLPFQGKAGELLQAMLAAAGLAADGSVFYTNLIKCRPRGNRRPSPDEIAACLPYLRRQITLLRPARILLLGRLATQVLLGGETPFEQRRGQAHELLDEASRRVPTAVTYHPASLLSRPQYKLGAWRDLLLARALDKAP